MLPLPALSAVGLVPLIATDAPAVTVIVALWPLIVLEQPAEEVAVVNVYVVVTVGDTLTVLLPKLFRVVVADDGPAHAYVTTALGVPVNTRGVVAPDVIDAVPVTLAVGSALTVTVALPVTG